MQQGRAAEAYLWWQSAISAGLLALLLVEAVRRRGMFVATEDRGVALSLLAVVAVALVVRTVWQLAQGKSSDALARTSSATFLAALILTMVAVAARVASAYAGKKKAGLKNPLRSRVTWVTTLGLLVLTLPIVLLATRKLLQARSTGTAISRDTLAELAEILARPWEAGASTKSREGAQSTGVKLFGHLRDPTTGLDVFIHRERVEEAGESKKPRTLVISFQGTRTTKQALANLDASPQRTGDCCDVHGGYVKLYEQLRPQLSPFVHDTVNEVFADEDTRLYVAGHSLGAAMAQLFLFDLHKRWTGTDRVIRRTSLAIFGGPTIGDAAFLDVVTDGLQDYANVTMLFDPIPAADTVIGPPLDRQVLLFPARPNRLFLGAHTADAYAEALRGSSGRALAATSAFTLGLLGLLVGVAALVFKLKLPRFATFTLLVGVFVIVWQIALRTADSSVASHVTLGLGVAAFVAGIGWSPKAKSPEAPPRKPFQRAIA